MTSPVRLWKGRTHHRRHKPFDRSFSYDVAMISLDVDRLDEADAQCRLFSVDKTNLLSFHRHKQNLCGGTGDLRAWAVEQFQGAGVKTPVASIELLTFPTVMGSGFAPISIWVGRDDSDDVSGVIYEVHNTFGEAHAYVFAAEGETDAHIAPKEFHVSPFFDVKGDYRFKIALEDSVFALVIENFEDGDRTHTARLILEARELSDRAIAGLLITMPFSGFGVILGIHWQALKLWLKGARYRKKPAQRDRRNTRAAAIDAVATAPQETRRSA